MNKFIKSLLTLFVLIPVLCAVALIWNNQQAYKRWQKKHDRLTHYQAFILSDLKLIKKEPLFPPNPYLYDGTQLIEKMIPIIGDIESSSQSSDETIKAKVIWSDHRNWYSTREDIYKLSKNSHLQKLDFSWLSALDKVDHISLLSLSKNVEILQSMKSLNVMDRLSHFSTLAFFDLESFQAWGSLYFAKKINDGSFWEGQRVFRKIRNLIQSAGSIEAQEMAVAMVMIENQLHLALGMNSNDVISAEAIQAYRRVMHFWPQYIQEPFFNNKELTLTDQMTSSNGVCSLAWMAPKTHFLFRDLLQEKSLFEKSFEAGFKRSEQLYMKVAEACGLTVFASLVEFTPPKKHRWPAENESVKMATQLPIFPEVDLHQMFKLLGNTPILRRTVAFEMEKITGYDGLKDYVDLQQPQ